MKQTIPLWTRDRIATELKKLHRSGHDICSRNLRRSHSRLHSAARHWFGSYRDAVQAAGIDYSAISHEPANRWSKKAIIRQIRQRKGKPLHHAAMEREMPALVLAAYRYFGTYRKAIEAAGLDYASVRVRPKRIWNARRIVAQLRQAQRERSGLWRGAVKRSRPRLLRAAQRYFGSYRRAAKAAGFASTTLIPPPYRHWSPAMVLQELQRMHSKREPLNPTNLREHHPYLIRVCARRFGSYRKAITAAGIEYTSVARILAKPMPAAEVITRLQTLNEQGKDLRYGQMVRKEPRLLEAARRRFGSYRAAMEAADNAYPPLPPIRHRTESLVIKTLHDLNRAGADLRYAAMKRRYLPLYEAARHYFGFYTNAVREAGIDYDRVVKDQLRLRRRRSAKRNSRSCSTE
jgi:hypothetical protein